MGAAGQQRGRLTALALNGDDLIGVEREGGARPCALS